MALVSHSIEVPLKDPCTDRWDKPFYLPSTCDPRYPPLTVVTSHMIRIGKSFRRCRCSIATCTVSLDECIKNTSMFYWMSKKTFHFAPFHPFSHSEGGGNAQINSWMRFCPWGKRFDISKKKEKYFRGDRPLWLSGKSMVFILDGISERGAPMWSDFGFLICLRRLLSSSQQSDIFQERPYFGGGFTLSINKLCQLTKCDKVKPSPCFGLYVRKMFCVTI